MTDRPKYTSAQLRARSSFVSKLKDMWKSNPNYADTLQMEIDALDHYARCVEAFEKSDAGSVVVGEIRPDRTSDLIAGPKFTAQVMFAKDGSVSTTSYDLPNAGPTVMVNQLVDKLNVEDVKMAMTGERLDFCTGQITAASGSLPVVHVVMDNDHPDSVWLDEAKAEAHRDALNATELQWNETRRFFRVFPFAVSGMEGLDKSTPA